MGEGCAQEAPQVALPGRGQRVCSPSGLTQAPPKTPGTHRGWRIVCGAWSWPSGRLPDSRELARRQSCATRPDPPSGAEEEGKALSQQSGRQIQGSCRRLWGGAWAEEPQPGSAQSCLAWEGGPRGPLRRLIWTEAQVPTQEGLSLCPALTPVCSGLWPVPYPLCSLGFLI